MSGTSVLDLWDGNERVGTVDGLARGRVQWVRSSARGEVRAATVQSGHLGTGTAARRRLTLARAGQGSPRVTLRPAPRSTGLYHPLVSTRFAARGSRSRRRTPAGQQLHPPKFLSRCQPTRSLEARREARGEAILFVVVTMALAHRAGGDEFARRLGAHRVARLGVARPLRPRGGSHRGTLPQCGGGRRRAPPSLATEAPRLGRTLPGVSRRTSRMKAEAAHTRTTRKHAQGSRRSTELRPEREHVAESEAVDLEGVAAGLPNEGRDGRHAPAGLSSGSPFAGAHACARPGPCRQPQACARR